MEITKEQSEHEAVKIKQLMDLITSLDKEYLTEALKQMRDSISFKYSAMVLNPNPVTAQSKLELETARCNQLDLLLNLRDNVDNIKDKTIELMNAKQNENTLSNLFK